MDGETEAPEAWETARRSFQAEARQRGQPGGAWTLGRRDGQLGTYAEIVDRHVELYRRLYWWGSVLDESDPLEEHLSRPRLTRVSPATQTYGRVEDEWLRDNLVAIAQLAESLDQGSLELAIRIVPAEWWRSHLPERSSTAESLRT